MLAFLCVCVVDLSSLRQVDDQIPDPLLGAGGGARAKVRRRCDAQQLEVLSAAVATLAQQVATLRVPRAPGPSVLPSKVGPLLPKALRSAAAKSTRALVADSLSDRVTAFDQWRNLGPTRSDDRSALPAVRFGSFVRHCYLCHCSSDGAGHLGFCGSRGPCSVLSAIHLCAGHQVLCTSQTLRSRLQLPGLQHKEIFFGLPCTHLPKGSHGPKRLILCFWVLWATEFNQGKKCCFKSTFPGLQRSGPPQVRSRLRHDLGRGPDHLRPPSRIASRSVDC